MRLIILYNYISLLYILLHPITSNYILFLSGMSINHGQYLVPQKNFNWLAGDFRSRKKKNRIRFYRRLRMIYSQYIIQCEALKIAKLVHITPITMVYGILITIVTGVFKPTYN